MTAKKTTAKKTAAKKEELKAPPPEVITLLPAHRHYMSYTEAMRTLQGRGNDPAQKAVISLAQWSREDIINAMLDPTISEAHLRYHAGQLAALTTFEQLLREAHTAKETKQ